MCSSNKPSALHSICVFDCPTEDDVSLCKFRIAIFASHAALSKSTSKAFLTERSLPDVVKMSKSVEMTKLFPLLYARTVHFFCLPHTPKIYFVFSLTLLGRACTAWRPSESFFFLLPHAVNVTSPTKPRLYFLSSISQCSKRRKYSLTDNHESIHQALSQHFVVLAWQGNSLILTHLGRGHLNCLNSRSRRF
jgi:hypothetical protein